jgi:acylphosphatase
MSQRAIRAIITGRVQGVNYRHSTHTHAKEWNITGWVRNIPDQGVEVLAFGEAADIEKLIEWLHKGPPLAHVTDVKVEDIPYEEHADFTILR